MGARGVTEEGNCEVDGMHAWDNMADHDVAMHQACIPVEAREMQLIPSLSTLRSLGCRCADNTPPSLILGFPRGSHRGPS